MANDSSRKRLWIAVLLAAAVPSLGHLYLRRVRRGVGWLLAVVVSALVYVPDASFDLLASGQWIDPFVSLPVTVVSMLSIADAYVVARTEPRAESPCPNCGRPLDPALGFCPWCTADSESQ